MDEQSIKIAQKAWQSAEAVLIGAGAGMGVDSGLPDFRGKNGFWKAYPPLASMGIEFEEMANPQWFDTHPRLAWGFYGHRLNLYRSTEPHNGFKILFKNFQKNNIPVFIFTSNVDGHFQKTGFAEEQITECHGSLMHLQCFESCGYPIWEVQEELVLNIDKTSLLAIDPLPTCPECGSVARPNILMFSDFGWQSKRTNQQKQRFEKWITKHQGKNLLVIEFGAGTNIPTVRLTCEDVYQSVGNHFIRVNPSEPRCELENTISLATGAEDAIKRICTNT
jgi:NAD-dependent SIR2 family protein deacetylase